MGKRVSYRGAAGGIDGSLRVEKSAVYFTDNELVLSAVQKFPDRLVGCIWPNPHEEMQRKKSG